MTMRQQAGSSSFKAKIQHLIRYVTSHFMNEVHVGGGVLSCMRCQQLRVKVSTGKQSVTAKVKMEDVYKYWEYIS